MNRIDWMRTCLAALAVAMAAPAAQACQGVGVIVRIVGKPQDVIIARSGAPVARPRVLEVICQADTIRAQNGTKVTLSLDGTGAVTVQGAQAYVVGARRGAPSLAGNAYKNVSDHLLPDMKRQPWDVRLRGPGRDLGFAITSLNAGHQTLSAGSRNLLVRLDGGVGTYKVQLMGPGGAVVGQASGASPNLIIPGVNLAPGDYVIKASDSSGASVDGHVTVAAAQPPLSDDFAGMDDHEVQAAAVAADLARQHGDTWSLEAEQILANAPAGDLDRESVFELIESYGPA